MKKITLITLTLIMSSFTYAQLGKLKINKKATDAAVSGVKAFTFTNEDAIKLAKEGIEYMDTHNKVSDANSPYTKRLNRLFGKHKSEDGLNLNYKVYEVIDINAFACADGSVRVFSSLMDILTDDELLAVIGHEIAHVINEDTKDAIKNAYKMAALKDAAASQSQTVRTLSESELGEMANAMISSKHDRKQETQADNYSYDFMKKHNYNVVGAYTAFKKLALLSQGSTASKFEKMFASHPDSEKRAESIKKKAKKDGLWVDPGEVTLPTNPIKQD